MVLTLSDIVGNCLRYSPDQLIKWSYNNLSWTDAIAQITAVFVVWGATITMVMVVFFSVAAILKYVTKTGN